MIGRQNKGGERENQTGYRKRYRLEETWYRGGEKLTDENKRSIFRSREEDTQTGSLQGGKE